MDGPSARGISRTTSHAPFRARKSCRRCVLRHLQRGSTRGGSEHSIRKAVTGCLGCCVGTALTSPEVIGQGDREGKPSNWVSPHPGQAQPWPQASGCQTACLSDPLSSPQVEVALLSLGPCLVWVCAPRSLWIVQWPPCLPTSSLFMVSPAALLELPVPRVLLCVWRRCRRTGWGQLSRCACSRFPGAGRGDRGDIPMLSSHP